MKTFLLTSIAVLGVAFLAVPQADAEGHGYNGGGNRHDSHHFDYRVSYRPYHGFGYDHYGYRNLSWSSYRWNSDFRCYTYWSPSYRTWFFFEPTYSYYVPVTYFRQVYPEFTPSVATVTPPPSVVQQTTVVVAPSGPVGPVAGPAPTGPIPPAPIAPVPTAVQNTKVVAPGTL